MEELELQCLSILRYYHGHGFHRKRREGNYQNKFIRTKFSFQIIIRIAVTVVVIILVDKPFDLVVKIVLI